MKTDKQETKTFNVRMPIGLWKYLKIAATNEEMSMMDFVCRAVENYPVKQERKNIMKE